MDVDGSEMRQTTWDINETSINMGYSQYQLVWPILPSTVLRQKKTCYLNGGCSSQETSIMNHPVVDWWGADGWGLCNQSQPPMNHHQKKILLRTKYCVSQKNWGPILQDDHLLVKFLQSWLHSWGFLGRKPSFDSTKSSFGQGWIYWKKPPVVVEKLSFDVYLTIYSILCMQTWLHYHCMLILPKRVGYMDRIGWGTVEISKICTDS